MQYKMSRVALLKEAVVKVTQILTNSGIEVRQQGVTARVEYDPKTHLPNRVFLPNLADDSPDELCDAIQGFLDSQVSRVLHSSGPVLAAASAHKNKNVGTLFNIIEDVRVEREMVKTYEGSASNMNVVRRFYWDKHVVPGLQKARGDISAEAAALLPSVVRALGDQYVFQDALQTVKSAAIGQLEQLLGPYKNDIRKVGSSQEALDLAARIFDENLPPQGGGGGGEDSDSESDSDSEDDSQSKPEKNGKKKSPPKKNEKKDKGEDKKPKGKGKQEEQGEEEEKDSQDANPGQDEPGEGKPEDGESGDSDKGDEEEGDQGDQNGDGQGDSDEDGEGDDSDADGDGESDGAGGDSEGNGTSGGGQGEGGRKQNLGGLLEGALGGVSDFDGSLADLIGNLVIDKTKTSEYAVYTTEHDELSPMPVSKDRETELRAFRAMEEQVAQLVGPMQKDLERAIAARSMSVKTGGHRSGRLNGAGLHRLLSGDDRVFARKEVSSTKDTAVSLVVDVSGSMSGKQGGYYATGKRKVEIAAEAAYALSETLERLGVKHEVICFTTREYPTATTNALYAEKRNNGVNVNWARVEAIYMPIIKGFDERIDQTVRARFGALSQLGGTSGCDIMGANADGESIEYAAMRLARQKPTRKVMIVLSDGQPAFDGYVPGAPHSDLVRRAQKIERAKIDLLGIGIADSSVSDYYTNNIVLRDAKELPGTVIREIKRMLMK